jgi:hypothetical protein
MSGTYGHWYEMQPELPWDTRAAYKLNELYSFSSNTYNSVHKSHSVSRISFIAYLYIAMHMSSLV